MIKVENDYEPVIYEQPFSSHIYENQSELLHNYYIEPVHSTPTTQKLMKLTLQINPNENEKTKCLNYKSHLSKHTKRTTQRKNLDKTISFRKSKKQRISTTRS